MGHPKRSFKKTGFFKFDFLDVGKSKCFMSILCYEMFTIFINYLTVMTVFHVFTGGGC